MVVGVVAKDQGGPFLQLGGSGDDGRLKGVERGKGMGRGKREGVIN